MKPLFRPPRAPAYKYTSLDSRPRAFRLVRLLPPIHAVFGDTLRIELITVDDASECLFDALSYTWGVTSGDIPDRRVLVETHEGTRELGIYRPLELALLNIKANRPIFVDQICINQRDDDEKVCQVQLMHDIYAKCAQLLVWLGPETKASTSWLTYMRRVSQEGVMSRIIGPNKGHFMQVFDAVMNPTAQVTGAALEDRDDLLMLLSKYGEYYPIAGLEDILRRPWFNRLWIIQEVCLAPNVLFICGSESLCFECFQGGLLFYTIYNTHWLENLDHPVSRTELFQRSNIYDLNTSPTRMIQERKAIHLRREKHSLYSLIIKYNTNGNLPKIGSSLAEDRVFGIMGLAEKQSLSGMKVRYGDLPGVFTEIAALLVSHSVDTLFFSQFPKNIPNLPSWAPDWSMNLQPPTSYLSLTDPGHKAGGEVTLQPRVDLNSRCLIARGVAIGKITRVGQHAMVIDLEKTPEIEVDYRSMKHYFDEIDTFLSESRVTEDLEMAAVRVAGFGLSKAHMEAKYPNNTDELLKKLKAQGSKFGQRLIYTDNLLQSYHISRIVKTIGVLPWYWIPAGETDTLQLWATDPIAAFTQWMQVAGLFIADVVMISIASARVVLTSKYIALRRKFSRVDFRALDHDVALRRIGLDPELNLAFGTYSNSLNNLIGQKVYLTEEGYVGTGPNNMAEDDVVAVLFGASSPLLLRRQGSVDGVDTWSYVGEAYCDGVMNGEALGGEGTDFHIV
ncbi:heterokaryon incompatibility protein [Dactylonectria estremocensis]|uniref:Heterokaryon incompatibility protein n=1 Tax=Dactylonectria estremocensis TaxID=1079267 RepID=A0A9P9F8F3_9HYPO|nr:heterokaryon incompatibility protein [Dactylonectria estremocensis]